ncbi:YgiQ family radical SAM protein [Aliikangiella coralliicola]|uniref:YgiQ family radical SAM protein n=1 Tax=Aliikangiella coralliicola TaxID=2592383 RepID=A0A545UCS2_9GAMM|nr:YgiQ family radical SAM protein [Aliikangiella coralliicola]TQV87223.1 YgiQ family radical SAM protein [Aliikangiella coralliicola]
MIKAEQHLFSYPKYWAECYGRAKFLPMSRAEMDELGWDSCDIIIVSGDAYVDHPSFGMAVIGRFLESQGFRVGIISQPDWNDPEALKVLGEPNLFFGITAGNMDSMINRYTADKKIRNDDAYTPHGDAGKRPDRAVIVYTQKCREAFPKVPTVIGGIEASLRRIAQYDYWSDEVRRSVLLDSAADILLYGNAERAMAEIAHQISMGRAIEELTDIPGTAIVRDHIPAGWTEVDSTRIDWPGNLADMPNPFEKNPYEYEDPNSDSCQSKQSENKNSTEIPIRVIPMPLMGKKGLDKKNTVIRLPSFEKIRGDAALYAHASRILHLESNPHNAFALVQKHGTKEVWINTPPIPLETDEIDGVFDLEYERVPHPSYGDAKIPAYEMIRFSVNIMRGCFGGCTFCSITEHEGRVIQSRSQESVIREIEEMRDKVPGFTGTVSDLGGPTANMYHLNCKDDEIQKNCRKLSCVYPTICKNLVTDHRQTTELYRKARAIPGVKRVAIASGLRYDLAVEDPEYVKELVTHHVGGYLKIAPEHSEHNTLSKMMKPGMDTYDKFKEMFDRFSKEAGKEQYLIPYFIAAHPGCDDNDMLNLALWLKKNKFRVDQVQTFYPSPMSLATAMYHSGKNPLKKVTYKSESVDSVRDLNKRRLQKAFLRYHDAKSWPLLRQALKDLNRAELIGEGPNQLIPATDPNYKSYGGNKNTAKHLTQRKKNSDKKRQSKSMTGRKKPVARRRHSK